MKTCGVSPEDDEGKLSITVEQIVAVSESPTRLPARFANELYVAGESGMGDTIFTVVFSDGSNKTYLTGNAVDFVSYPNNKEPADVVSVLPYAVRDCELGKELPYYWCLYFE